MRFSIVIPTRNRPQLVDQSLPRILSQSFTDFEVLVLENSDVSTLSVWSSRDVRVRVVPSARTLSMPDNWERGLDLVRGDYVLYLADKDWLVPGALSHLAQVAATQGSNILNYRKASWGPGRGLVMQHNTGVITTVPSGPVLREWFSGVTHLHHAPMIYNSAVRRETVLRTRAAVGNRFFVGNSPDIASGVLLCSHEDEYTVIDRVYVLGIYGEWSIGTATALAGRRGPAAAFAAEFQTDPLAARGLMWSLSGAVVHTLLECQHVSPARLRDFPVNWQKYLDRSWTEIERRESLGEHTDDAVLLEAGVGRLYSRSTWLLASFRPLMRKATQRWAGFVLRLRSKTPLKIFFPPYRRLRRLFGSPNHLPRKTNPASFRDEDCFVTVPDTATEEDAMAAIVASTRRLASTPRNDHEGT